MYAQHYLAGSEDGDFFLVPGSDANDMLRTSDGWSIEGLTQHISWSDGNQDAVTGARARSRTRDEGS
jgi:hypothetical protein